MFYQDLIDIISSLQQATLSNNIKWQKDRDGFFNVKLNDSNQIYCRPVYFEEIGEESHEFESPHMIQYGMPGLSVTFASGSEGYYLLLETLAYSFKEFALSNMSEVKEYVDKLLEKES